MSRYWRRRGISMLTLAGLMSVAWLIPSCTARDGDANLSEVQNRYEHRMVAAVDKPSDVGRKRVTATPVAWQQENGEREALLTRPSATSQPAAEDILAELPDPIDLPAWQERRLEELRNAPRPDQRVIRNYEKYVDYTRAALRDVSRPVQVRLTLSECVQRALEHNYSIRYESYGPAISQAQVVEAEAAFDAEFFLDFSWNETDQATSSELQASLTDQRDYKAGFRKLLPSGMQVQASVGQARTATNFVYQTLNPAYDSSFIVSFTQPLLRNFGLRANRAQIEIRKAERDIAHEKFVQEIRDRLLDVESAYWRLMQARRAAAILGAQLSQNHVTFENMVERLSLDATEVEVQNARSRWFTRQVEFQEAVKNVRDAEDQLINLLNDPDLTLSADVEIVPMDTPFLAPLALDQLAAVRTALDQRSEIRQARRAIDSARINTGYAKNQLMPKLDLSFQYEVQGIGISADNSFDNLTTNRFTSYAVSVQFAAPIGNRQRRAAYAGAQHRETQATVSLHRATDSIVQEVNAAVRTLQVRYAQFGPQLNALQSAQRTLESLQARTQRIDPTYLDSELGALERLASARQTLLQVIAEYNIAIAGLEKAKGTLLEYNNVVVTDELPKD